MAEMRDPGADEAPDTKLGDLQQFKDWYKAAKDHSHKWRQEAFEDYAFVAGDQWSPEDAAKLKGELRPVITFNYVGKVVDSVAGLEVGNRQEVRFIPRLLGQAGVNELLTNAAKWARDECDAEDEESDAFVDTATCGMGWTQSRMDYDTDPDGMVVIERVDPLEMFWDPAARKRNLSDARFNIRVRDLEVSVAEDMFPDSDPDDLHAEWADDYNQAGKAPHDAQQAPFYRNDQSGEIDRERQHIRMVEVEWWEYETAYRTFNPITQKPETLSAGDHAEVQRKTKEAGLPRLTSARIRKKHFYKAIVGRVVLSTTEGPERGGFTYKAITGKRDRNAGTWYGLVRAMKDPQKWANKWLAQILHIINSNAKGGVMAELDAFDNPQEARDTWSRPDSIAWLAKGALSGPSPKILPKPTAEFPNGLNGLMEFAVNSIPQITGINLELLGLADRDQAGVLEMHRKQAGMAILGSLFDSLRRYRKENGRLILYYIQEFISDGRLIRIGGPEDAQYVPLVRQPDLIEYDVVVDDTPTSPNMKERTWAILISMFPILSRMQVPPQILLEMLKYSPLPETMVAKIEKLAQQAAQQPPRQTPLSMEEAAKAALRQAEAQAVPQKLAIEAQRVRQEGAEIGLKQQKTQAEIEALRAAAMANLTKAGVTVDDQRLEEFKAALDALLGVHGNAMEEADLRNSLAQPQPQPRATVMQ